MLRFNRKLCRMPICLALVTLLMSALFLAGCKSAQNKETGSPATRGNSAARGRTTSGLSAPNSSATFDAIKNRVWKLVELKIGDGATVLDRAKMDEDGIGDMYILQFNDDGVNGKAAPNRYFAPFKSRENTNIELQLIVGTLMAATINVGGLMENSYYWYLQRVSRWELAGNTLSLYSTTDTGEEVILHYVSE